MVAMLVLCTLLVSSIMLYPYIYMHLWIKVMDKVEFIMIMFTMIMFIQIMLSNKKSTRNMPLLSQMSSTFISRSCKYPYLHLYISIKI